jgi:hypothetical protein
MWYCFIPIGIQPCSSTPVYHRRISSPYCDEGAKLLADALRQLRAKIQDGVLVNEHGAASSIVIAKNRETQLLTLGFERQAGAIHLPDTQ